MEQQNTTLIEREKIEGTPFTLIKQNEQWFIAMGDHRLTEPSKHKNEQILKLEKEKWLILTNVIIIILDKMNKFAMGLSEQDQEINNLINEPQD